MTRVALCACPDYDAANVVSAVERAVRLCGGMEKFVRPGQRVLLKPNLLSAAPLAHRVTTDPAVVRTVGKLVLKAGGRVVIGDSPAIDKVSRISRITGMKEVADELGADLIEFCRPILAKTPEGSIYHALELEETALTADVVINLPKLKTHCMMLLTMGVKNLFGTVVGPRKSQWHMHAGADRIMFADLLLDICRTVKPALTILDGVWGMQGRGPNNGTPCHLGFLAASCDPLVMDLALAPLLGVHPASFPLYNAAVRRSLVRSDGSDTQMVGDDPNGLTPKEFQLPVLESAMMVPGFVSGLIRRHLTSRPVQDPDLCRDCGKCAAVCPPGSLEFVAERRAVIDHMTCIRCYCCQEVCPANAIHFKTGALVGIAERLRAIMPY
ncbi:hypothetical protein DO021_10700 [Desulfobacter hydrogenophilus]|uniref:DUF362 domain-containing protein n=1 Tax=Desulfobacter hydrogenophilus TaxID=2291 RepID=A0A328FBM1_9BACT|nr:DUF362 domain-containing protein [Desulfobacter hydrogenophilus]NDY71983.1 DUF362 domain-containing protein [Desulfobacter hydrogenophilus]QBH12325.1 DUF362 domain-containing protein [Desulfobacter hydrogenophilus]RAM02074.1 hypothetical protein DO021_10700 [Desulfobacter hydrogenophilus]